MAVSITTKTRTINNGDDGDAAVVEANFTELYNNDTTLGNAVTVIQDSDTTLAGVKTFSSYPLLPSSDPTTTLQAAKKGYVDGLTTGYLYGCLPSSTGGNTVTIAAGRCMDGTNTQLITVSSPLTLTITSSGANGLDTGAAANSTWYYAWVIRKSSDGTVAGLLSTSSSSPTMPTGYDQKRLLPFAVRRGTGAFLPIRCNMGWPDRPHFSYTAAELTSTYMIVNGTGSAGWNTTAASTLVPPISRVMEYNAFTDPSSATVTNHYLRETGSGASTGDIVSSGNTTFSNNSRGFRSLNSSQQFDFTGTNLNNPLQLVVTGFVVTEV